MLSYIYINPSFTPGVLQTVAITTRYSEPEEEQLFDVKAELSGSELVQISGKLRASGSYRNVI